MRKLIGGNFGFKTFNGKKNYFNKKKELNNFYPSGRSAFIAAVKYLFKKNNIEKIEIPCFLCESIVHSLIQNNIKYSLYSIDMKFNMAPELKKNTLTLLVNFFGMNHKNINKIIKNNYNHKFIVDDSHSFLNAQFNFKKYKNCEVFFSLRKFVPIIAGKSSVKNESKKINNNYKKFFQDNINLKKIRFNYFKFPFKNIDKNFEEKMISKFQNHEKILKNIFSSRTPSFVLDYLNSINWLKVKKIRQRNFKYLSNKLKKKFEIVNICNSNKNIIPLFLLLKIDKERDRIREYLFSKRILAPIHWPKNKIINYKNFNNERKMKESFLSIPIDQRYNLDDMEYIFKELNKV